MKLLPPAGSGSRGAGKGSEWERRGKAATITKVCKVRTAPTTTHEVAVPTSHQIHEVAVPTSHQTHEEVAVPTSHQTHEEVAVPTSHHSPDSHHTTSHHTTTLHYITSHPPHPTPPHPTPPHHHITSHIYITSHHTIPHHITPHERAKRVGRPPSPSCARPPPESGWFAIMILRCASLTFSSLADSRSPRTRAASRRVISGRKPPCRARRGGGTGGWRWWLAAIKDKERHSPKHLDSPRPDPYGPQKVVAVATIKDQVLVNE